MAAVCRVNVLYNYFAQDSSQISLQAGQVVTVYDKDESGWWDGYNEYTGERGLFPSTYVEEIFDYQPQSGPAYDFTSVNVPAAPQGGWDAQPSTNQPLVEKSKTERPGGDGIRTNKKEAGGGGGGGGEKKGEGKGGDNGPKTRFGMWATNMCRLNGFGLFLVGIASVVMVYHGLYYDTTVTEEFNIPLVGVGETLGALRIEASQPTRGNINPIRFNLHQQIVFASAIPVGLVVFLVEWFRKAQGKAKVSIRAIVYTLLGGIYCSTLYTLYNGVVFIIAAAIFQYSVSQGEVVKAPPKAENKSGDKKMCFNPFCCLCNYYSRKVKEGKLGKEVFMYLWIAFNIGMLAQTYFFWIDLLDKRGRVNLDAGRGRNGVIICPVDQRYVSGTTCFDGYVFTPYLPWARVGGKGLNVAATFILLPVSRTFIRKLYDFSTQDQTLSSRMLRRVLWLFPLDKALHFHEKTGWLILFYSFFHSFTHLLNAGLAWQQVITFYEWSPLITGFLLWQVIFFLHPAVLKNVKFGHFEIFWYAHQGFWFFFPLCIIHGRGSIGPNYWKWFIVPGGIYIIERIYREYSAYQDVPLISVTNMKGNVFSMEFSQSAFPNGYLEGQYVFLNAPFISRGQWHPFTISSAPGDPTVTVHIKTQGAKSWTKQLLEYLTLFGPKGASYFEFADAGPNGKIVGKTKGPQGEKILRLYGPHSAPTQHAPEYPVDIIVGSGIGVTPVSSTMQQIVFHRWKFNIGDSNPDHAYFVWVCNHNELETFRWMIRTVKECHDEVYDLRVKNPESMGVKTFEVHIFVTSIDKDFKPPEHIDVGDETSFWGRPRKPVQGVAKAPEQYSELDIYRTMLSPPKGSPAILGDIRIYNGRPNWDLIFGTVQERHVASRIGVAFCGNPRIADDLKAMCRTYTNPANKQFFVLHKENF